MIVQCSPAGLTVQRRRLCAAESIRCELLAPQELEQRYNRFRVEVQVALDAGEQTTYEDLARRCAGNPSVRRRSQGAHAGHAEISDALEYA